MEFLTQQQRFVVDNFGNHCKKLIEYGFAYAAAHPEAKHILDCEVRKIRVIERQTRENPGTKNCLNKMLRDANIQYIVKIIKLGMKYVQNNPQCAKIIQDVQITLNEFDKTRQIPKQEQMKVDDDFEFKDVLNKLNEIKTTLESIEARTFSLGRTKLEKFRSMKETGNWENFKQEIDTQLNERKARLKVRRNLNQQMQTIKEESSEESSKESLENLQKSPDSDDDESISEVLVNCETYNDPNPSKKPTARVGNIQRNLFIPIQTETPKAIPKITPKVYFKKENDGSMKFNVKLNFAERVMCNDRLVNSINIQNLLPQHKINNYRR
ncbi:hypothetical protein PVAND_006385 [Polypedilum vanderplanki]|uniref:Uncharacterized protein n=1 Tax=Polypedilum vanderplanki TaxID=319348 RepID=A0A9J6C319_POLVA|nr:hypothetical protein PVAND_006385 [Polypedilum vanderplanki]